MWCAPASLLAGGAIGEAVTARASFEALHDPFWYPDDSWRYEVARTGGGVVVDGGAHWIRPLRMWLGEVEEVVATTARVVPVMQGESLAHALLRFRSGVVASFQAITHDAPLWAGPWWRLTGTAGEIIIHGGFDGGMTLVDRQHPQGRPIAGAHGYAASFAPELADFEAVVLDGKSPKPRPRRRSANCAPRWRSIARRRQDAGRRFGCERERTRKRVGSSPDLQSSDSPLAPDTGNARVGRSITDLWPLQRAALLLSIGPQSPSVRFSFCKIASPMGERSGEAPHLLP